MKNIQTNCALMFIGNEEKSVGRPAGQPGKHNKLHWQLPMGGGRRRRLRRRRRLAGESSL